MPTRRPEQIDLLSNKDNELSMLLFGAQFETALQVLAHPLHLAVVLFGTVFGAALAPLIRRCEMNAAVPLVLALPVAALLDPVMGLLLLGSLMAATCGRSAGWGRFGGVLAAIATAIAVLAAGHWVAARLEDLGVADKISLLLAGAAAAVIAVAAARRSAWLAALLLCAAGLALQTGPQLALLPPIYAEPGSQSPLPLLLGLLVAGPALRALVVGPRSGAAQPGLSAAGAAEPLMTMLPVLLAGVPVTLSAAVFILNSEDYGLQLGPHVMTQRPKLVVAVIVGLILAAVLAVVLSAAGRWAATLTRRWAGLGTLSAGGVTRLAAAILIALAIAALYQSGLDQNGEMTGFDRGTLGIGAVGMILGAIAAWRGIDLAPLAVGLVIGRMLQPLLAEGLDGAPGTAGAGFASGSLIYLAGAGAMIAAALAWPLLTRFSRQQSATP